MSPESAATEVGAAMAVSPLIPVLLVVLALVDAMFCGFRDAAGRRLLIEKGPYYQRAVVRGLLAGVVVVAGLGLVAAGLVVTAADPRGTYSAMCDAGAIMVWVYGAYATLVLAALLAYLVPAADASTLATVIILGPFTLIRPWVIWAGAGAAAWSGRSARTAVLAIVAALAMTQLEPALGRAWRRGRKPVA